MNDKPVIDFTELGGTARGEALEELTRHLAVKMGMTAVHTGRGADRGKDLLLTEKLDGPISHQVIHWLVSCKDFSKSGKSVAEKDVGSILDKVRQHGAHGFLLVTTTTTSTGLKALLDSLDIASGGEIHVAIWDRAFLTVLLAQSEYENELKLYLPQSFRRFRALDEPNLALEELCSSLPPEIAAQVKGMARPHLVPDELSGHRISPHDLESARKIDLILEAFFAEDFPKAVAAISDIHSFMEILPHLEKTYPDDTRRFLHLVVQEVRDTDIAFNAYYFLQEHYEVSPDDQIQFVMRFGHAELDLLYGDEVASYLYDHVQGNIQNYDCWRYIETLSSLTELDCLEYKSVRFKVDHRARRVTFSGTFCISVKLNYGPEYADLSGSSEYAAFPGEYAGYFDTTGIFMQTVTVDTSAICE